jgi:hypothetical protein
MGRMNLVALQVDTQEQTSTIQENLLNQNQAHLLKSVHISQVVVLPDTLEFSPVLCDLLTRVAIRLAEKERQHG